ncbi:hypothetical protein A2Y85_07780 [candidate division WOR-3 bacterium RBG_13_43_14]|uniref:DUF4321 domain-containing protein n=1 Tax=candidate division WOR-3 bacterium RBG_13_43_14 TaxID=1802590 RepID=A0A1F4UAR8_UNCW3|nr:MAG: hypothetical protein A2Y85_07780 [candidate division WOR-3 bacterium RBG_13_43_14]
MAKRKLSNVTLGVIIGGIIGSALSYLLSMPFPKGPVKNLFFSALKVGFDTVHVNLGFFNFSLGLGINITLLTVIFIFITIYLLYKL